MSLVDGAKTSLHCHHCGREVGETTHSRTAYRVDYYALHTGDVEPATISRRDDPTTLVTVLRLVRAIEVLTCADCYRQPGVRRERELLFRPEVAPESEQGASS
jgi:hypothetical protein